MASSTLTVVYATDEDIYNVGPGDFGVIVPRSNKVARGTDGVFASNDLWTLTSASSSFVSQGVVAGMIFRLYAPTSAYNPPEWMAVETVSAHGVTLRRPGLATGIGLPPGPTGGLTGISFDCLTLKPQIENTAFRLNEQYSVDPSLINRKPSDIYDQRIFRELTALRVLYFQYMTLNRNKLGDFADKQKHYSDEYDVALASATLRWGATGTSQPPTGRFSTRLVR